MRIVGIDPGLSCGWASVDTNVANHDIITKDKIVSGDPVRINEWSSGVWNLSESKHSGAGMRYVNLWNNLVGLTAGGKIDMLAYEEVTRHTARTKGGALRYCTESAHIYGGIVATIQKFCHDYDIPYQGITVGTIKKHATGKGNAGKPAMIAAAQQRWSPMLRDDNEVDARWIADCAIKMYGKTSRS